MTSRLSFESLGSISSVFPTTPVFAIYVGNYKFMVDEDKAKMEGVFRGMRKTARLLRKMEAGLNIPRIGGGPLPD